MLLYHHGYLLTGDVEKAEKAAFGMAAKILGADEKLLRPHPDFSFLEKNPFTIDYARTIREKSSRKSFSGKGRVFVIKTNSFTREANNALLKTLEEPAGTSYFFLITNSAENILDTLRSRLLGLTFSPKAELTKERKEFAQKFLRAPLAERVEAVKEFAAEKERILSFLDDLEVILREKLINVFSEEAISSLDDLARQRNFLLQRSSSPKMVVEHLSFVLPEDYN